MRPLLALAALLAQRRGAGPAALPVGMQIERDLAYGLDPRQRLDVYRPPHAQAAALLVLVHGGAWAMGDKALPAVVQRKLEHWLPKGVVVVSVNYRLLPQAEPLEQARDVARALAFVQAHAVAWGADPQRLVLMGHSTGAHLAALLLADAEFARREGAEPWQATVLLDSAALDVVHLMRGAHLRLHDRAFGAQPAQWEQASPLHRLSGQLPRPLALVHSTERPSSGEQSQRFAAALRARGGRVELLPTDLSHAEVNARLGDDSEYTASVDAFLRSVGWP